MQRIKSYFVQNEDKTVVGWLIHCIKIVVFSPSKNEFIEWINQVYQLQQNKNLQGLFSHIPWLLSHHRKAVKKTRSFNSMFMFDAKLNLPIEWVALITSINCRFKNRNLGHSWRRGNSLTLMCNEHCLFQRDCSSLNTHSQLKSGQPDFT